jgi:hypothetical protein
MRKLPKMQLRREFVKVYLTTPELRELEALAESKGIRSMSELGGKLFKEALAAKEAGK